MKRRIAAPYPATIVTVLAAISTTACSADANVVARSAYTTATSAPYDGGIIQLRPIIPPRGAIPQTCPVGEALSTCTASFNFSSWERPVRDCPQISDTTNPSPDRPAKMMNRSSPTTYCTFLAPASFVVTTAASVDTNIELLQGHPGIEITVPRTNAPALDAAIGRSFKQPVAIVASGQLVYSFVPEPTNAEYQPIGGTIILYAPSALIQRIVRQLRP